MIKMKLTVINISILCTLFVIFFTSCSGTSDDKEKEGEDHATVVQKDTSYVQYTANNHIKSIVAKGFSYSFGNPQGEGSLLYAVNYSEQGYLLDSIIYANNLPIATLSNTYNDQNKLLKSVIKDSLGEEKQKVERTYDANGNVLSFQLTQGENVLYSQKMTYDKAERITKITEYDEVGDPRIVSNYVYNDAGKLVSNEETDASGTLMKKTIYVYDAEGNNTVQTIYASDGNVAEKNFLKNFDAHGNAKLIEKYDRYDSLIVIYQYEYNEEGIEIKSIIYDGIGQIIRQAMSTLDAKGNQTSYEMYEGGKGFIGKDEIKYNDQNQEIELIVLDKDQKQIKRKTSVYNNRNLLSEVTNFDKVDEPQFKIVFSYTYYK